MIPWFKRPQEPQSGPRIAAHIPPTVSLLNAAKALHGGSLCRVIYVALADKPDISAADLEDLSNRIGRLAHERNRA
jgi:CTP:molybdopterin cytidylyltransferase MocA